MSEFGGSIDELKVDRFEEFAGSGGEEGLSEEDESLLGTDAAALDDDEVVSDNTVVREAAQRSDVLLSDVGVGGGVVLGAAPLSLADSVDLLVELSPVEVT